MTVGERAQVNHDKRWMGMSILVGDVSREVSA
jgi:hypothetical protein